MNLWINYFGFDILYQVDLVSVWWKLWVVTAWSILHFSYWSVTPTFMEYIQKGKAVLKMWKHLKMIAGNS